MNLHPWINFSTRPLFWLVAIGLCIPALHLTLEAQVGTDGFFTISLLFWGAVGYSLWERRQKFPYQSDPLATALGGFILGLSSLAAISVMRYPSQLIPLYLFPFWSGLGFMLLASGWSGWRHYRRELLLLFFLGFPLAFLHSIPVNMTVLTAKFATFGLWYAGFNVLRIEDVIRLPSGSIFVFPDCSGIASMSYLWSLAVLIGTFLALSKSWRIILGGCGVALGFLINGIRVMLLAVLVSESQDTQFHFWHDGSGSLIFSVFGALLLIGLSYWFAQLSDTSEDVLPNWNAD